MLNLFQLLASVVTRNRLLVSRAMSLISEGPMSETRPSDRTAGLGGRRP